jgi:hypothetical protein
MRDGSTATRVLPVVLAVLALAGCGTTRTVTVTTIIQAAPAPAATTAVAQSPGSFSGNGTKSLGTITIDRPSIIEWRSSGPSFALTSGVSGTTAIAVSSTSSSGTSAIGPGAYPNAQVISAANWTIRIVAQ